MNRIARFLKHSFIPHEGNDHKPHLLRPQTVAFVALLAIVVESVFLFGSTYVIPRSKLFGAIFVNTLIDGTNSARVAANLPTLRENPLLDAAAQAKADDMAANRYFAHTSPAGITPWYWFEKVGYNYATAGENLAVDFTDSGDVTSAWLDSPGHRANIMSGNYTEIGMATAQGEFNGHPTIYVVEMFGTPAEVSNVFPIASAAETPTPTPTSAPAPKPTPKPVAVKPIATTTPKSTTTAPVQVAFVTPTATVSTTPVQSAVKGTETVAPAPAHQANFIQTLAAEPRRTLDYIYLALASLFAIALLLNVFIKVRVQHPQLIFGGMLMILVAGLFVVVNQHAVGAGMVLY